MQYVLPLRYTYLQWLKLLLKEFLLPSISLLDKIIKGNFGVIKTVNLFYQNGSLSKGNDFFRYVFTTARLIFRSRGEIISLSDKNEMYTLYYLNSTCNEMVYIILIKNFAVYCLCSLMPSRCTPVLHLRKTTPSILKQKLCIDSES